jgi:hypothetical protein
MTQACYKRGFVHTLMKIQGTLNPCFPKLIRPDFCR